MHTIIRFLIKILSAVCLKSKGENFLIFAFAYERFDLVPPNDFVDEFICLFKTRSHDVMQRFRVLLTDYLNKRTEANNCILNCKPKIKHATGGRIGGRGGGETQGARQEVLNRLSVPYTTIALKRTRLNNPITPHGQTQQVNSISRSSHFQELLLNFD